MSGFQVRGTNASAPFTLKAHRGEGMVLLAMNWRGGKRPRRNFVGFAIQYQEPGKTKLHDVFNRIAFLRPDGSVDDTKRPSRESPIQAFRWVVFPTNAELPGEFTFRVQPVFMDGARNLTYGPAQEVAIRLARETYPGVLNATFTRGFVSSQAFVDRFQKDGPIAELVPDDADAGLDFKPTHPDTDKALPWMGFEARSAILEVLDAAIADTGARVAVVAYDLNEPEVVERLEKLGPRLRVIVDDSGGHGQPGSAENEAASRLVASAGQGNVRRQHMGNLQHNKTIVVDGPAGQTVVCGSTNFSWRGFYVQSNNAMVLQGAAPVAVFTTAFESYFGNHDDPAAFAAGPSAQLTDLGLPGIDARVAFSPHSKGNALLKTIADDIAANTTSSLLYSLAFLYESGPTLKNAIKAVIENPSLFVYGISDKRVGGLDVQAPNGDRVPLHPAELTEGDVPEPFKSEPSGLVGKGRAGTRMHHKFVVIDFDKPTARVYLGSYNFSGAADKDNGENLLLIRDRRVAVAYAIEALRICDHYEFRVNQQLADKGVKVLALSVPPATPQEKPWWDKFYTDPTRILDRKTFT